MENLNTTPDLVICQLSAVELQRLDITVAQVRAAYTNPAVTIEPGP